jgi:hypothetical protein
MSQPFTARGTYDSFMKSPQGREAKKPKKAKVKTPPRVFDDANRKSFTVPKTEPDSSSS